MRVSLRLLYDATVNSDVLVGAGSASVRRSLAAAELSRRGVNFSGPTHRIAEMDDHDLWMAFFSDPDAHILALMQEAPKGYRPLGAQ